MRTNATREGAKPMATDNNLLVPPSSSKDQERLNLHQKNKRKPILKRTGFSEKALWDWLMLIGVLAIPIAVAFASFMFSQQQNLSSQTASERQHQTDLQIAAEQQRESTLRICIEDMKDLLLNKGLRTSKPEEEVRAVARVEVLTALRQLDGERKGLLIRFLSEAGLITSIDIKYDVIIDLSGAELTGAELTSADLSGAHLNGAHLNGAHLNSAHLARVELIGAELNGSDLNSADLSDAHMNSAHLSGAHLNSAHLTRADLMNTDLTGANLRLADLTGADLRLADLTGADLRFADLSKAQVTQVQLDQALSLQGTTLPDGSKHP